MISDHDQRMFVLVGLALAFFLYRCLWLLSTSPARKYISLSSDDDDDDNTCCSETDLDEILVREAGVNCTVTISNEGGGSYQTRLGKNTNGNWEQSWV